MRLWVRMDEVVSGDLSLFFGGLEVVLGDGHADKFI